MADQGGVEEVVQVEVEVAEVEVEEVEVEDPAPRPMLDDTNPLFAGARRYYWQQYLDAEENAKSHNKLIAWMKARLAQQTAAENNGVVQEMTRVVEGNSYSFGLTADSGFFKIVVIPAEELTDEQRPLTLIFSFRDLYLVGFLYDNMWYLFDDARLIGSGHEDHPDAYRLLGFNGTYVNTHFSSVKVGNWELHMSYDSLIHYPGRSLEEILVAIFRYIVLVPEACRFPRWHRRVQYILKNLMSETIDTDFATWFQRWSSISKKARRGKDRFVAVEGGYFTTFESLLLTIDGGVALSRPPEDQL